MPSFRTGNNVFCVQYHPGERAVDRAPNVVGANSGFKDASPELYYRCRPWIESDPKFGLYLQYQVWNDRRADGHGEPQGTTDAFVYDAPQDWRESQLYQWIEQPTPGIVLDASPGTYILTGQNFTGSLDIAALLETYTLSGYAAELSRGIFLDAAPGTYGLTGQAISEALEAFAEPGVYTLSGQTLFSLLEVVASSAVYSVTGNSVAELLEVAAAPGTYLVSGQAIAELLDIYAVSGGYNLSGAPAELIVTSGGVAEAPIRIVILRTHFRSVH